MTRPVFVLYLTDKIIKLLRSCQQWNHEQVKGVREVKDASRTEVSHKDIAMTSR